MSKQSEAKEAQDYRHEGPRCGNCRHFTSDLIPIKWMAERNDEFVNMGLAAPYDFTKPQNLKEDKLRCGIGGFAVKKMGCCRIWEESNGKA